MIRLPRLFKRKLQSDDLDRGSVGARRTTKKFTPRALQRSFETQDEALTEDPEQQRARHRLIGAAVLVLVAVVGLPRILDNKPKAVSNDIAVNIVTSLPNPVISTPTPEASTLEKTEAKISTDPAPRQKESPLVKAAPTLVSAPVIENKTGLAPVSTAGKSPVLGLAAGEEVVVSFTKPKTDTPTKSASASIGTGKFVLQIGAFASEDRVNGWVSKLKAQKIPNVVTTKKGADGVTLFLLRAGPFPDKDSADTAEKRVKAMGLTPRLVEVGSP
jgi:DedD protein